MSLIQEALKRQQAEFGDGDKKNPPANLTADNVQALPEQPARDLPASPVSQSAAVEKPPAEPAGDEASQTPAAEPRRSVPLPDEPLPAEEDTAAPPAHRPWLGIAGVVIFGLLILGAAGGMVYLAVSHFRAPADSASRPLAATAGTAVESSPAVIAVDDSASVVEQVEVPAMVSVPASPASADVPSPATMAQTITRPLKDAREVTEKIAADRAATEIDQQPSPVTPPPQPPARTVAERKPPPRVEPPKPVKWPALHLTGLLRSAAPGEGAARINNTMVFIGGEIEGVTLMQIQEDGVLLRYQNENRLLRVGATLY